MEKFLNDFKTALAFFMDLRRIKPVDNIKTCTSIEMGYSLLDTVEGTVLYNCGKISTRKRMDFSKHCRMRQRGSLLFHLTMGVIQQIKYGQNKQIICGLLSGLA